MENKTENKFKLFVQYWGNKVCEYPPNTLAGKSGGIDVVGWLITSHEILNECTLHLQNPLKIKDEHALAITNHLESRYLLSSNQVSELKGILNNLDKPNTLTGNDWEYIIQQLRYYGYAFPYNGISIEHQVKYGWIKLTN